MSDKPLIKYDPECLAWTDGTYYVAGKNIRAYSKLLGLRKDNRGRLSREEIATYFLDKYGVSADVE